MIDVTNDLRLCYRILSLLSIEQDKQKGEAYPNGIIKNGFQLQVALRAIVSQWK